MRCTSAFSIGQRFFSFDEQRAKFVVTTPNDETYLLELFNNNNKWSEAHTRLLCMNICKEEEEAAKHRIFRGLLFLVYRMRSLWLLSWRWIFRIFKNWEQKRKEHRFRCWCWFFLSSGNEIKHKGFIVGAWNWDWDYLFVRVSGEVSQTAQICLCIQTARTRW